jgi:hypothetical protein
LKGKHHKNIKSRNAGTSDEAPTPTATKHDPAEKVTAPVLTFEKLTV